MGVKERRARQKGLLRQEILDAAREILVREGYDGLSMRKVAEKIDYSPTAIYLHFKDRDDLVFCVCEQLMAGLVRELRGSHRVAMPIRWSALKKGLRRYVEFGLKHPEHYQATFMMPHSRDPETDKRAPRAQHDGHAGVRLPAAAGGGMRQAEEAGEGGRPCRQLRALGRHPRHHLAADRRCPTSSGTTGMRVIDQLITMMVDGLRLTGNFFCNQLNTVT